MFEVVAKDLLGRIGRIETKSGKFETPAFIPVINPVRQEITASEIKQRFRCKIVITNAYILYTRLKDESIKNGVHGVLSFDGIVMTDSGGYQILEYGDLDVTPEEIAQFEEDIGSDIAVPLDVPTGLVNFEDARKSVERTLENIRRSLQYMKHALWVAPIQGGVHRELLELCIKELLEMPFQMFALGSPTPLMESYRFVELLSMISIVKQRLPPEKPLHLFGAGHPMLIPLAVALGCDTFDSASYYLYAKEGRYMTPYGTKRIESMVYLPCECDVCSKYTLEDLMGMDKVERTKLLAIHNLHMCFKEVREVKQAIVEGRLMELLEIKSRSHPSLYAAIRSMLSDEKLMRLMMLNTPISKRRGINLFDRYSMMRPEVRRAREMLLSYSPPKKGRVLVLVPQSMNKQKILKKLLRMLEGTLERDSYDLALFMNPYGIVPLELSSVYPFSQTSYPISLVQDALDDIVDFMLRYIKKHDYDNIIIIKPRGKALDEAVESIKVKLESSSLKIRVI